jgi:ECF sigma factor
MSDFTHLIKAAQAGDRKAAADLLPLVYDELRQLAAAKWPANPPGTRGGHVTHEHVTPIHIHLPINCLRLLVVAVCSRAAEVGDGPE